MYRSGFVQDCLNIFVGFLHIHWLEALASLEDKIKPATCIYASLARSGYFSFLILHTHFLMTADLLLSFSGFTTRKKLINDVINASWKSYNDTFLKCHGIDCHCINWANNDAPNKHHL